MLASISVWTILVSSISLAYFSIKLCKIFKKRRKNIKFNSQFDFEIPRPRHERLRENYVKTTRNQEDK